MLVNGSEVFNNPSIGCEAEIPLGALADGDTVSLELSDNFPPFSIEGFQLLCKDTGAYQALNPDGFYTGAQCGGSWPGGGICYSPTYVVAL